MKIPNIAEKNVRDYFMLLSLNPDLPTIPMVDSDIVAEDNGRWSGRIGEAHIDEFTFVQMWRECPEYLLKDDLEEYERYLYEETDYTDEQVKEEIAKIEWQKAIFLNIDMG